MKFGQQAFLRTDDATPRGPHPVGYLPAIVTFINADGTFNVCAFDMVGVPIALQNVASERLVADFGVVSPPDDLPAPAPTATVVPDEPDAPPADAAPLDPEGNPSSDATPVENSDPSVEPSIPESGPAPEGETL